MKRNILFLDIDGILNTDGTSNFVNRDTGEETHKKDPRRVYGMDRDLIANLQRLVELTGAEIILSSTWRKPPFGTEKTMAVMRRRDWTGPDFAGETPVHLEKFSSTYSQRGAEIDEWIERNGLPDDHYLVLDDNLITGDSSMYWIFVNPMRGFDADYLKEALRHFGVDYEVSK